VRALAAACVCLAAPPALAQANAGGSAPSAAATPAPPAQQPLSKALTGLAKAEFEAGKILYQDGDFANAIVKFQHAYEIASDARLLWNIAVCEKSLRHYTKALAAIDRYQREGGARLTAVDRKDAQDIEKVLRTLISTMKLLVSEPSAEIFVDDEKVGTSPLPGPLMIDVGRRAVRVHKPGFRDFVETRQVEGATEFTLVAKLEREVHQGRVLIEAGPKDLIALDGKAVAQGRWEAAVGSGGHSLRVTAPGMAAYQTEIMVQDNEMRRIQVSLNPLPKAGAASPWAWIAGSAALVGAAVIGGALLFRPTEVPPAQGTLGTFPLSFGFGGRR
jgi:hypothetical protein